MKLSVDPKFICPYHQGCKPFCVFQNNAYIITYFFLGYLLGVCKLSKNCLFRLDLQIHRYLFYYRGGFNSAAPIDLFNP